MIRFGKLTRPATTPVEFGDVKGHAKDKYRCIA